jgi:hypothetical protein
MPTADELVAEHFRIKDWIEGESKRFDEHIKPQRERMNQIAAELLAKLIQEGQESAKTQHGTAYISRLVTPKVEDRTAFLDFCLENWEQGGNEMLQIGAPQKDALENYKQVKGELPPGVTTSTFTKVNIRRS